ncbi:NUDIX hydrolase [Enterococcus sp.]|uniref:NUDIX hydrolase n=1 Tax=Enterococcus sp. TaxID=35783 RepID=UPI0028A95CB2|nr:NUDIX hydrolase [Enterococcus sp.]
MEHTAFGVYGIMIKDQKLLVIKKNGGPYQYRYDLPGGSLEMGELLEEALCREVLEETGAKVAQWHQLGVVNFLYPWTYQETTENNHICVFYKIDQMIGDICETTIDFEGQDSIGALYVPLADLNEKNASLPVLKALAYSKKGIFSAESCRLKDWEVLSESSFDK